MIGGRSGPVDPRAILIVTLAFAIVVGLAKISALLALVLAVALVVHKRLHHPRWWKEVLWLNTFLVFIVLLLPVHWHVDPEGTGRWIWSVDRFASALLLAVRANAIFLFASAWARAIGPVGLVEALRGMWLPDKLTRIVSLTVRYGGLLRAEVVAVRRAMLARGFRTKATIADLNSLSTATGMVLLRSLDRSERLQRAIDARSFGSVASPASPVTLESTLFIAIHAVFLAALVLIDCMFSV